MARAKIGKQHPLGSELGGLIGEALGDGIAAGLEGAFERVRRELAPLGAELAALAARAAPSDADDEEIALGQRPCAEARCERRAIARGLCRRHYARQVYQERKAREGKVVGAPRRRPRLVEAPAAPAVPARKLAPVAPIVRRKRPEGEPAPVTSAPMPAAATHSQGVTVESMARFLGVKN